METEVTAFPLVFTGGPKRFARNPNIDANSSPVELKNNTTCKNSSCLISSSKQPHSLVGGPYRGSMRLYTLSEPIRSTNKNTVVQRVTSAKMLRVKQLQNQLADAHYHLNELANENRLLKALQKRQDSALKRYEGTNAELPRIINSHHEELKVLQTKYKKLRTQYKHTCELLKEKENEIHSLQTQNKHLIQLSKDRNLQEREKLQMRVSDLNFRIEQQQETIQTLTRKLALESKSLKRQLNSEVSKHKDTQKELNEALDKLRNLEDLLGNREKRLYSIGRFPICGKGKSVGSQTPANSGNNGGQLNVLKSGGKYREVPHNPEARCLPKLAETESNKEKTIPSLKPELDAMPVTETMSSLQQVRKFRLQRSYSRTGSAGLPNDLERSEDDEVVRTASGGHIGSKHFEKFRARQAAMNQDDSENEEVKRIVENFEVTNGKGLYKIPKQLTREFGYSSSESESEDEIKTSGALDYESSALINKSRDLHNRLIGGEIADPDTAATKFYTKKSPASTLESESDCEAEKMKTVSNTNKNYTSTLETDSKAEDESSSQIVEDFLRLGINATDSDLEMERLCKVSTGQSEGYESSQQRLMNITKSWTELQEKIKKKREVSENEIKAMENENPTVVCSLEEKLSNFEIERKIETSDNLEKEERLSSEKNDLGRFYANGNSEIPYSQRNGTIHVPKTNKNASSPNEMTEEDRHQESEKEPEATLKNVDSLINKMQSSVSSEDSKKSDDSRKMTTGENNIESDKIKDETSEHNAIKVVNYNKQKLLAAMKAIDDNENIEFLANPKHRTDNISMRSQSTVSDNLYRGLPAHARKKNDILKEIFGDAKTEVKLRTGSSKQH